MRVVIHGGLHKTGTTAVQHILASAGPALMAAGFLYPGTGHVQHSHLLDTRSDRWHEDLVLEPLAEARRQGAHTLLLSGEVVSKLDARQLARLVRALGGVEVRLVFGVRHWWGFWPSRWKQNCRRRDSQCFHTYLEKVTDPGLRHPDTRFDALLERAASMAPGIAAVSVEAAGSPVKMIEAVLAACGLPAALAARLCALPTKGNISPPVREIELMRLANGCIASRLGLPQDALFHSIASAQRMPFAFKPARLLKSLDSQRYEQLLRRVGEIGQIALHPPDMRTDEERLFGLAGVTWTNVTCPEDLRPASRPAYACSAAVWQDVEPIISGGIRPTAFRRFCTENN